MNKNTLNGRFSISLDMVLYPILVTTYFFTFQVVIRRISSINSSLDDGPPKNGDNGYLGRLAARLMDLL